MFYTFRSDHLLVFGEMTFRPSDNFKATRGKNGKFQSDGNYEILIPLKNLI